MQTEAINRLPASYVTLISGHMAPHKMLIDDSCIVVHDRTLPLVNAWQAARYTIPGLVAHESALHGGELMRVPDLGDAPGTL